MRVLREALLPGCAKLKQQYPPRGIVAKCPSSHVQGPLISIVIPSYNQAAYLEQTLQSLISQEYSKLEIIVVDGGSQDESVDIIRKYEHSIRWWVSEPDRGQAHAINKGMARARGEILGWLNSDDCLVPGALQVIAETFDRNRDTDVVYGHRILVNEDGKDIGKWIVPPHSDYILAVADYIPQETMYWRRRAWQRVGERVDETFHFAMDWELIMRFRACGACFYRIPAFIGMFRIHGQQKTQIDIGTVGFEEMRQIKDKYQSRAARILVSIMGKYYQYSLHACYLLNARLIEIFWKLGVMKIG